MRPLNKTELSICGQLYVHITIAENRLKVLNLEKMLKLIPDPVVAQAMVKDITVSKEALERVIAILKKIIEEAPKEPGLKAWKPGDPVLDTLIFKGRHG